VQKKLGPAWTDRGRPPIGWFTKRTAEAWLRDLLDEARRGWERAALMLEWSREEGEEVTDWWEVGRPCGRDR
jgi:hypothetical protein